MGANKANNMQSSGHSSSEKRVTPTPLKVKMCHVYNLPLRWKGTSDRLHTLKAKQKLFSLSNKNFLDEDLTRAQIVELKQSKKQVMANKQGNGQLSKIFKQTFKTPTHLGGNPELEVPNDRGPLGEETR